MTKDKKKVSTNGVRIVTKAARDSSKAAGKTTGKDAARSASKTTKSAAGSTLSQRPSRKGGSKKK